MPEVGFEPLISGLGSDHSAYYVKTKGSSLSLDTYKKVNKLGLHLKEPYEITM